MLVSGGINHSPGDDLIGTLVKSHFPIEILNKMDPKRP